MIADFETCRVFFVSLVSLVFKHEGHEAGTKRTKGLPAGVVLLLLLLHSAGAAAAPPANGTEKANPYLGQPAAIDAGEQTYREKCIICHGRSGGRGPDLFAITLSDEEFVDTVEHGRPGTLMPAFGSRLSRDDILKIRAFLKANPNGI